jgi:hypothetical protein
VYEGQLWQLQLVASQWSILNTWKDKMPKFRYLAAKGDFLQFISEYVPLIQEAAERDGEGIGWNPDTIEAEFLEWLEALLKAEGEKIEKDAEAGADPEAQRYGCPSIDVWYVLAVLERIAFKSSAVMHRPISEENKKPVEVHHFALRRLCTYYNQDKLDTLTNDDGLLTLLDVIPSGPLEPQLEKLRTEHKDRIKLAYENYPVGKWPDEETLKVEDRKQGVALAKSYTSSIPCIMLAILEFLWVREGNSADRRAGEYTSAACMCFLPPNLAGVSLRPRG